MTTRHWLTVPQLPGLCSTQLSMDIDCVPGGCPFAAAASICSSFSSVIDLIGRIFGLHSTSLRLPFSE
eukprot:CAMPEP_0119091188 /NCGR_PEP_ID=MMETSP1178-20130426/155463_1 /TAXON_ID=33656 /ORGANISM="unid sp, Strain CCMP2000" /LENGTH=67 /DNA_ID=CAMNT_0007074667 /DNA_START=99 /DNA_END=302 /DNA_ORIENTATION=-